MRDEHGERHGNAHNAKTVAFGREKAAEKALLPGRQSAARLCDFGLMKVAHAYPKASAVPPIVNGTRRENNRFRKIRRLAAP